MTINKKYNIEEIFVDYLSDFIDRLLITKASKDFYMAVHDISTTDKH